MSLWKHRFFYFEMSLSLGLEEFKMIDGNLYRMRELYEYQNIDCIEKTILDVLKDNKVTLSQTRTIFNRMLANIEDNNLINL